MVDNNSQDKLFMNELKIGDVFITYNHYSYIYYLGKNEEGEYMFYSVTLSHGYSLIYYYTEQGVCIALPNYAKISRNILHKEITFNMIKKILLKNTKLPDDVIGHIKQFIHPI